MPIKRYKPEQIVTLLRQIEVEIANGNTTPQACKEAEIPAQSYYRWRQEYGGLKLDQAKRLKELASPGIPRNWKRRTRNSSDWWRSCRWRSRFSRM
jgi:Transposase